MSAKFYSSAVFVAILYSILATVQNVIFAQIGYQMYSLESFPKWFLILGVAYFLLAFVLLKYYRMKAYHAVFWTGVVAMVTMFVYYAFIYISIMAWVSRAQTGQVFIFIVFIAFIATLIYAVTLVFSFAGRQPWLRRAGIFMIVYYGILMISLIVTISAPQPRGNESAQKIQQWATWLEGVWPLFFVALFINEKRTSRRAEGSGLPASWGTAFIVVGVLVILGALFVFPTLSSEKEGMARWQNRPRELSKHYAEPFDARTFVNDKGKSISYRFMKPSEYDSTQRYPLVLCLHGGAGVGTGNYEQIEGSWGALMLLEGTNRKKFPAFILVPQCPPGFTWGGIGSTPTFDSLAFELLAAFEKEFPIDTMRRYIIGESLGGYGTWHFISSRPEMFAAAIPICGEGDPSLAAGIAQVAVWAFHGEKDRSVPVSGSRDMIEAMRKAGGNPRYNEFEGAGHIIKDQITHTDGVFEWLFEQKKLSVNE